MSSTDTVRQVDDAYPGPLRGAPLSVELHNTLYAVGGRPVDGLADADGLRRWLSAIEAQLPLPATAVDTGRHGDFLRLRDVTRDALDAVAAGRAQSSATTDALNALSAAAPRFRVLEHDGAARWCFASADPTDVVIAVLASEAIDVVGGPQAADLRACGAPGCVLMFLKDHPRREWCSAACGNRARQARHYARTARGRSPTAG